MKTGIKRHCLTAAIAALTTGAIFQIATASAALSLSQHPLFLGTRVAPNVFIELDDSGSMDFEILPLKYWQTCAYDHTEEGSPGSWDCGALRTNGRWRAYTGSSSRGYRDFIFLNNNSDNVYQYGCGGHRVDNVLEPCPRNTSNMDWRLYSSALNVLYYNPEVDYRPWSGSGYPDANFSAVRSDPAPGSHGYNVIRNLGNGSFGPDANGAFVYQVWLDDKGYNEADGRPRRGTNINVTASPNGEVDLWDSHFRVTVNNTSVDVQVITYNPNVSTGDLNPSATPATAEQRAKALGLRPDGQVRTDDEIRKNIANWYQYGRRRSFVAKAAIGNVLETDPYYRYGLSVFNRYSSLNVKFPSATTLIEDFPTHNANLLNKLFTFDWPNSGTPLRNALKRVGEYYKETGTEAPITHECQQSFTVLMTDGYWNGSSPTVGDMDGDGISDTAADVARLYYDQDLRSDLADNVPSSDFDGKSTQHMVTFTAAFGVEGNLRDTNNDGWPDPPLTEPDQQGKEGADWGSPAACDTEDCPTRIDDLWHAAYNSRGRFVSARTPEELAQGLQAALADIGERTSSASTIAIDAGVYAAGSKLFQARFYGGEWWGELLSLTVDKTGQVSGVPDWNAAEVLATQDWNTGRVILTTSGNQGIPFRWANLDDAQKAALDLGDGKGEARLEYLRGSDAHEGVGYYFRSRKSGLNNVFHRRLGDIVHGSPVYVGKSPGDDDRFNRTPIVYVAANDGMIHGFNATTGEEKLAYVPNLIFEHLHELTSPTYGHRYYVDGAPVAADVELNGGWSTVLIGGLRGGGKGLYALDITDPRDFSEANAANIVLWEFEHADMGYVFGQPAIVRAGDRWVAIVGNGYNSNDHHAVLFVIDVATGTELAVLDTEKGNAENPNGLASPAPVDTDGDGDVDIIYAGDLLGNLWRFDYSGGTWQVAYGGEPLFTAISPELQPQPITSRPEVDEHPTDINPQGTDKGYLVYFGTGKYIEASDTSTSGQATQSFYAIWDRNDLSNFQSFNRDHLLRQEIVEETGGFRVTSDNLIFWHDDPATIPNPNATEPTHLGWYIDLAFGGNNRGERQVTDSQLRSQKIVFNTLIPSENACDFGGSGWLMVMDAISGSRLTFSPLDVNGDKEFSEADFIEITIDDESKTVPVTGRESQGISSTPVIVAGDKTSDRVIEGNTAPPFRNISPLNPGDEDRGRQTWRLLLLQ